MKRLINFGSMKQLFCFILDKKSTTRWSDSKIVCSYTQTEERLDFINTQRIEICLPFVPCITCSIHSCLVDDFVSSWIKSQQSDGMTTKSFAAIQNAFISSTLGGLRFACPLCVALLAAYTAVFSMISFDTIIQNNLNKRNYLAFRLLDQVQELHNLQE